MKKVAAPKTKAVTTAAPAKAPKAKAVPTAASTAPVTKKAPAPAAAAGSKRSRPQEHDAEVRSNSYVSATSAPSRPHLFVPALISPNLLCVHDLQVQGAAAVMDSAPALAEVVTTTVETVAAPLPRATTTAAALAASVPYTNKQRVLVFGSRGLTSRYRHLMLDLRAMLPHHKKDSKLDTKDNLSTVNEIAEMKGCNTTIFFDVRKKRDLFVWLSHTPSGPSVKFHAVNVHTMDELRLTGNCLKGSRPILSFDRAFDDEIGAPHLAVVRELFTQAFATPRGHPKSQPFHDHVINVGYADGKVWVRHYQIVDTAVDAKAIAKLLADGEQPTVLVEIGPRFVLDIVRIFAGSMGGATLWTNPRYVAPNAVRHEAALVRAGKYGSRQRSKQERADRDDELTPAADPLADVFR